MSGGGDLRAKSAWSGSKCADLRGAARSTGFATHIVLQVRRRQSAKTTVAGRFLEVTPRSAYAAATAGWSGKCATSWPCSTVPPWGPETPMATADAVAGTGGGGTTPAPSAFATAAAWEIAGWMLGAGE